MNPDLTQLSNQIKEKSQVLTSIRQEIAKTVIGQETVIERLLIALLCHQHVLLEGVPGLAKTLTVNTLAKCINTSFHRIQFTPDLLPSDIIGTQIYNPRSGEFSTRKGPIFANIILADEINRAPAKVQSALLEAMQERQITIGEESFKLEEPFLVLATQNPVEQEGTYPLPEAQMDRFMFKVNVTYPNKEEELEILRRMGKTITKIAVSPVSSPATISELRDLIDQVFMDEKVEQYIVRLVDASRHPSSYKLELGKYIRYGASPRATIFLALASKAHALIQGRAFVTPQDVKSIAMDVLRHRVAISYEAEAEEITSEFIVQQILNTVEVP